ncbi:ketopantoate reductase family protein [Colwellia sp. M166]|jgi:2-dehydropantoate 2-reductase|uniref:ketopantoate reductase family protein n=1 Tax=Colwellia sp. M166 TaxID=2583805 RepID=UPI00211F2FF5|nr:2-dehydropantoate 2-reductase [Colwellia sp. M166]|tara:strand:+ start:68214 stop:69194 length:981 start_codon:yes stop_codon:yes gene_type:complete
MHFVIVGCGAVGGYFGGRLAQHGENVTFIARGQQFESIKTSGLTIKSIEGDVQLDNVNVLDASSLTCDSLAMPADVIFLCVKSYQLTSAIAQIKPLILKQTRIISLLNGVNAAEVMQEQGVAGDNIIGGLAKIIAEKSADGVINHTGAKPHITLGIFAEQERQSENNTKILAMKVVETEQLSAIAKRLKLSGISVGVTSDINLALWRKFILVAAWGALAASRKLTLGEIRSQNHVTFLLERIVNEYADIARKVGVKLGDKHIKETLSFLSRLPDNSETSLQRDLTAGGESEFDVLIAYPMTLVKALNLSAPVLTQCYKKIVESSQS